MNFASKMLVRMLVNSVFGGGEFFFGGDECDFDAANAFYDGEDECFGEYEDTNCVEEEEGGGKFKVDLNFANGDDGEEYGQSSGGECYGGDRPDPYGGYAFARKSHEEEVFFGDLKHLVEKSMNLFDASEQGNMGLPPTWSDGGYRTTWCQLFVGSRFTNAGRKGHSLLPSAVLEETAGSIHIPSMYVKDILSIKEFQRQAGKATESVVNMKARKFHTEPVDLSSLFSSCRAVHVGRRYFLDRSTGHFDASEALLAVINNDDREELVLPKDLLAELLAFIVIHNRQGGYASCEVARLRGDWYGVKNLEILGHEEGQAPVNESEKVKNWLNAGQRYVDEYANARLIGSGRSGKMIGMYYSRDGIVTEEVQRIIPASWDDVCGYEMEWPTLPVPCRDSVMTVNANGGISVVEKAVVVNLRKPLYLWAFQTIVREKSKSGCRELVRVKGNDGFCRGDGVHTVLSLLGALPINDLDLNGHLRVNKGLLDCFAEALMNLPDGDDILTLDFCDTGEKHTAGNKGDFPIYSCVPVIRIQDRWYDLMSLSPRTIHDPRKNLRYLRLDQMTTLGPDSRGGGFGESATKRYDIIPAGTAVSLKDLVNRPERNGDVGVVKHYNPQSGRYTVELEDTDETMSVKPANLRQRLHIRVHGIESKPELNGNVGVIVDWIPQSERYSVQIIASGMVANLKPANVILKEGTVGQIVGLTSRPELNGSWGTVKAWIQEINKYDLQLCNDKIIRVKAESLRV